jgi:hypothetical protein
MKTQLFPSTAQEAQLYDTRPSSVADLQERHRISPSGWPGSDLRTRGLAFLPIALYGLQLSQPDVYAAHGPPGQEPINGSKSNTMTSFP